ncbi:hypothetical protein GCK72_009816 [Caenorhabditis remanei]|uniref:Small acidic protein-like domain-containing protein n=1 Tax=Caenorhabditis remanei TaxID=31234 RepID=A0A6A5H190_CAERE|nr:hypothetical protein GCK72_009816 [Caenorhabditis remanei]KAF1761560.1 hypothetical protein GCK72_009816 [Caenorhabditis remanei]
MGKHTKFDNSDEDSDVVERKSHKKEKKEKKDEKKDKRDRSRSPHKEREESPKTDRHGEKVLLFFFVCQSGLESERECAVAHIGKGFAFTHVETFRNDSRRRDEKYHGRRYDYERGDRRDDRNNWKRERNDRNDRRSDFSRKDNKPRLSAEEVAAQRKALWGSKKATPESSASVESTSTSSESIPGGKNEKLWSSAIAATGVDSSQANKFMRLMGVKNAPKPAADSSNLSAEKHRQDKMLNDLEKQYAVARETTHMGRGTGFGFGH